MCGLFDTTIMLGDDLAVPEPSPLPQPAVQWLTTNAWKQHRGDWYCDNHAEASQCATPTRARPTARTCEKRPIDPLLGQHRMVADPQTSAVQAAAILGCPTAHVYRQIAKGLRSRLGPAPL
jgi:hypothetical protein